MSVLTSKWQVLKIFKRYYKIHMLYAFITWYFFEKIKKKFELWSPKSKVSTLIPVDVVDLIIWLTNIGTHKVKGPTLKTFSIIQAIRLGKAYLFFN